MGKYGSKDILVAALVIIAVSSFIFGIASTVNNSLAFYVVSAIARSILGYGEGMALTCVPAIIAAEFPKERHMEYQSYYTMSQSLGLALGPVAGAFIYELVGYAGTFYFFTVLMIVSTVFCYMYVP